MYMILINKDKLMDNIKTYKQFNENNINVDLDKQLTELGYRFTYYDDNVNDVPKEEAKVLHIGFHEDEDGNYESIFKEIKIPKKKELDLEYVMNKINTDKIYKNFSNKFNDILKSNSNVSAYPTSYGIGFFALFKSQETKDQIEEILNRHNIKYSTEYSDAGYVFRYKISKSKENIENIDKML